MNFAVDRAHLRIRKTDINELDTYIKFKKKLIKKQFNLDDELFFLWREGV